jgi:hypothetical protein
VIYSIPHCSRHLRSIAAMSPRISFDGSPHVAEIGISSLMIHFSFAGIAHGLAIAFRFTNKLATAAMNVLSKLRRFIGDSPLEAF